MNLLSRSSAMWVALCALSDSLIGQNQDRPPWAYPTSAPGGAVPAATDDGAPKHVPGSNSAFTLSQIRNLFDLPDWHSDDHPRDARGGRAWKEAGGTRLRLLSFAERTRSSGEFRSGGSTCALYRAADGGL